MNNKKKNGNKFLCNDLQGGEGRKCPNGHFPNINIHKKINCHLKI